MKIAFSTIGCPDWTWADILIAAKDLGYNGIELRGIGSEIYLPRVKAFLPQNINNTKKELDSKGLEISCVTSSCYIFKEDTDQYFEEGKDYINLAHTLGAPYVRVLGDSEPYPQGPIDHDRVAHMLSELGKYASPKDVKVLIETNGVYADSNEMLNLIQKADHPNVGILWDIHHPFRYMNEPVEETYRRLKDYISYVHIKDSKQENGKVKYYPVGQGDIPVKDAIKLLKNNGYDGYVSLEWVKRWNLNLEDPGIVFPHFINAINDIIT